MALEKTAPAINEALAKDTSHISSGPGMANATTEATIKDILKNGTPDWVTHPEDYKAMAKEDYLRNKENSDAQVREYRLPNQEVFTDEDARRVNVLSVKDLLGKLRAHGLRCCVQQNEKSTPGTAGLFVVTPGREQLGLQFVTTVQVPAMYEWSVLRVDEHGLPNGEKFIGWRNLCVKLVEKGIWTEDKVHKVFGRPPLRLHTSHYFKSLYDVRNFLRPV